MAALAERIEHRAALDPAQELLAILALLPHLAGPAPVALELRARSAIEIRIVLRAVEQARRPCRSRRLSP
jgi:hypothetical protein